MSLDRILRRVDNGAFELVSLDVFETLITRTIGEPSSLFLLLGQRLRAEGLLSSSAEAFAHSRIRAEKRARSVIRAPADVTLEAIYSELVHGWFELAPHREKMIQAEMAMEREVLYAIPGRKELLSMLRAKCGRVVFVSDMYLPTEFVREQLLRHGLATEDDAVYVSSACQCKKSHGGALFTHMLKQEGVEPVNAIHIGDSAKADVNAARNLGMTAIWAPEGTLNRYETALEESRWESSALSSAMAGASRRTRLIHSGEHPDELVRVLAGVAAPLLVGFTLWLFRKARESGINRLYFLAREGEALYEIGQMLNEKLGLGLDLRYLYISRQAINLGLLDNPTPDEIRWILNHSTSYSLRGALKKTGLTPEQIASDLARFGLPEEQWDSPLSKERLARLVEVLGQGAAKEVMMECARNARCLIDGYLAQEGYYDDEPVGLVDTTGTGSQLRTMAQFREQQGVREPQGFLVIRNWRQDAPSYGFPTIHTYIADHFLQRGWCRAEGLIQMLEIFTLTDYGTVLGYQRTESATISPIFQEVSHRRHDQWSHLVFRTIFHTFVEALPVFQSLQEPGNDARAGILSAFSLFWDHPLEDEALCWGSFPFELGSGSDHYYNTLAPALGLTDLIALARNRAAPALSWHSWGAAAKFWSPPHVKLLIRFYRWLRSARSRISQKRLSRAQGNL